MRSLDLSTLCFVSVSADAASWRQYPDGGCITIGLDRAPVIVDVARNGRDDSFNGEGLRGCYLIIEPATDDEVVVRDIQVRYERH